MRKILVCVLVACAAGVQAADPDVTFREAVRAYMDANGVTPSGVTNVLNGAVLPGCNGAAVTNLNGANIASGNIALARLTNGLACAVSTALTNTVASTHTPGFTGQVLLGLQGYGTNAVWIAKGVTTNDWVKVAP